VVAGDIVGEGASEERAVLGETPNLAARLQALAEPGSVLVSASTRRLTGRLFSYADAGRQSVKGLAEPVQVWRVTGALDAESRFAATRSPEAIPLVGRDTELMLLVERWRRVTDAEGQVTLPLELRETGRLLLSVSGPNVNAVTRTIRVELTVRAGAPRRF